MHDLSILAHYTPTDSFSLFPGPARCRHRTLITDGVGRAGPDGRLDEAEFAAAVAALIMQVAYL
jgi:hypothetical protein